MPQDQFIHCIGDSTKNTLTNPANKTRTLFTPSLTHQSTTIAADAFPRIESPSPDKDIARRKPMCEPHNGIEPNATPIIAAPR
jgi:hypothetical protein